MRIEWNEAYVREGGGYPAIIEETLLKHYWNKHRSRSQNHGHRHRNGQSQSGRGQSRCRVLSPKECQRRGFKEVGHSQQGKSTVRMTRRTQRLMNHQQSISRLVTQTRMANSIMSRLLNWFLVLIGSEMNFVRCAHITREKGLVH